MVDIHSHILPFLDDGAESMEEAITMAKIAVSNGINHMVASCHGNYFTYSIEEYWEQFDKLQDSLRKRDIPLKLYSGMEVFMDGDVFSRLEMEELLSLNRTKYLLVEFPFEESITNVQKYIASLQQKGYSVILAHPERYCFIQKDPEFAYYLEEKGCILQINQGSLTGDFGSRAGKLARQLLSDGVAGLIATDAHDTGYRTPATGRMLDFLKSNYSDFQIHLWLSENPSRILKGYPIIRPYADREEGETYEKD